MTGGGAADLAWLHEPADDYTGSPTDSTYKVTGHEQQLDDLTIDNALQRLRNLSKEAIETIETTFEGAISVTGTVTEDTAWLLDHVYGSASSQTGSGPYTYTWVPDTIRAQSARFYVGLDYLNGYAERELKGVVFPQIDFDNAIGEASTFTATGFYADEALATSATPSAAPSTTSDPYIFHGGSISIDSTTQKKLQDATLSIQTGARPQRTWDRKPVDAVLGPIDYQLDVNKIVTATDLLTMAYGNGTAPTTSPNAISSKPGEMVLGNGSDTLTFPLTRATPNQYAWENIGNAEEDKTESPELFVDEVHPELSTSTSAAL